MRRGASPTVAAGIAIHRIARHYPQFMGAVIALTKDGQHGAACHGMERFPYVAHDNTTTTSNVILVSCTKSQVH